MANSHTKTLAATGVKHGKDHQKGIKRTAKKVRPEKSCYNFLKSCNSFLNSCYNLLKSCNSFFVTEAQRWGS